MPFTVKLDSRIALFCKSTRTADRILLAKNGVLPKPDIRFWKVAKITHFLATFLVLT